MRIAGRFFRFLGAGATATAVHYATLVALVTHGVGAMGGSIVGSIAGLLTHYLLSSKWVFFDAGVGHTRFPRFILVSTLSLLLNAILVWLGLSIGLHYLLAQATATLLVLLINYSTHSRWTFANGGAR